MSFLLNVEYDHHCDVVFEVFSFPSARNAASIYTKTKRKKKYAASFEYSKILETIFQKTFLL